MMILIGVAIVAVFFYFFYYNTMIARKNEVRNALATIDTMLKMRFDLIPNLVASVKESAKFETSTMEKVIALRNQLGPNTTTAELQKIDRESTQAVKGFMVQVEAYPDLKTNASFVQLQNTLMSTEEQIAAARRTFNAAVTNLNNAIEMFPTSFFARMMGLKKEQLLEIPAAERANPNVGQMFKDS
jgi:LemA protein